MKKYKSIFLFLGACVIIAAVILFINSSLEQILPDYKNMPFYSQVTLPSQTEEPPSARADQVEPSAAIANDITASNPV